MLLDVSIRRKMKTFSKGVIYTQRAFYWCPCHVMNALIRWGPYSHIGVVYNSMLVLNQQYLTNTLQFSTQPCLSGEKKEYEKRASFDEVLGGMLKRYMEYERLTCVYVWIRVHVCICVYTHIHTKHTRTHRDTHIYTPHGMYTPHAHIQHTTHTYMLRPHSLTQHIALPST